MKNGVDTVQKYSIKVKRTERRQQRKDRVKVVHNVPSLRFWYRQEYYHNDLIPTFHNLTQLELYCSEYSKELLLDALNHCPKLQRLDLDEDKYLDKEASSTCKLTVYHDPDGLRRFPSIATGDLQF
ncbi:hypothetical protein P8452_64273 [Trifolium repens]|nr:hypothetical protein P8452_64273 [Trifolium repens]